MSIYSKQITLIILSFIFMLLLQSCFVAKEYTRPEISLQEHYKGFVENDSTSIAMMPWTDFFKDPQLVNLIRLTLQENYELKNSYQNILAAESFYLRGRSQLYPNVGLNASVTSSDFSQNSAVGQQFANLGGDQGSANPPNRIEQYDFTVSSTWEADIWGRLTSIKRAEFAELKASQAIYRALQTRLISDIATTYYQILALKEKLNIADRTIKTREKSVETISLLKESGQATEVGVKQTESQLIVAQIVKIELEKQLQITKNVLWILTTMPSNPVSSEFINIEKDIQVSKVGYPLQLLKNRPDIKAAEAKMAAAFQLTQAREADFYPKITLTAEAGFQSLKVNNWFDTNSFYNNLIAGLAQPIFNKRAIKTRHEVQKARKEQALLDFRSILLTAQGEVSDALINHQAFVKLYKQQKIQLRVLEDAVNFSNKLLTNGYANYLEVLRANDQKLAAELGFVDTKYGLKKAKIDLYRALGGGWNKDL